MIEKCTIEVIWIPEYDDDGSDDVEDSSRDRGDDKVEKGSLVAVFVFHDIPGEKHIGTPVCLYSFTSTHSFMKGKF